jgi:hypothetical protein
VVSDGFKCMRFPILYSYENESVDVSGPYFHPYFESITRRGEQTPLEQSTNT